MIFPHTAGSADAGRACDHFQSHIAGSVALGVSSSCCVVGLRCLGRSGKLHQLAKKTMIRLMGPLLAALAVHFFNGLKSEQGLLGPELQWSQMSSFG